MSGDVVDRRREKLIQNEETLRRANELIDTGRDDQVRGRKERFLCECSIEDCTETVELVWDEYRAIRDLGDRFVIRPGHETAGLDRLIEEREGYLVVDKGG